MVDKYSGDNIMALFGAPVPIENHQEKALLAAVPEADPKKPPPKLTLQGEVATPIDPPPGCRLQGRCPMVTDVCRELTPELIERQPGHYVACHNL